MSTKLSHRNNKGANNHSLYQTSILADHTELLTNIKDNTADLDINTDGLEASLTSIDTNTTGLNNCVSGNELQCDIVNQPNVKVEDLSSSLNAQNVNGTTRSLAVGLKGTTNISDVPSGSTFLLCDSQGHLQVDIVSGGGTSDATAANQVLHNTKLDTIATNTTGLNNCVSGNELQVDIVSGGSTADSTAANQLTTHSKLDTIETTLNDIETNTDKITQGYDATVSSGGNGLFQSLVYGRDSSGNLDALNVDNNGHLKIAVDTVENKGSTGNLVNNASLSSGALSSAVNISDFNRANIAVEDSSITVFDDYEILVSENDSNYYLLDTIFTTVRNSKREGTLKNQSLHGWKYLKIKNNSSSDSYSNVVATVVGTPN